MKLAARWQRECERPLCGIGVDTRGSKGERETKNLSEKDCRKSWNLAKVAARDKKGGGGGGRTMWWPYAPSGEMSDDDDG